IDSEGFELRIGGRLERLQFDSAIGNTLEARQALVELARRAL
ncbi:MAG: heme iron utilization protein, partial [Piscirickettsiaceae bacterium]|nr:heme iron utilization protein [Piscirickettsiaceae bacterium]